MRIIRILIFLFCAVLTSQAQPAKWTQVEDADEHLKFGNYLMAIPILKAELKKEPNDLKIRYKLGICYLHTRLNYEESVTHLLAASKDPKTDPDVWLHLGKAYQLTNRFEDCFAVLEKYKTLKPKHAEDADRILRQCELAQNFRRNPSRATFQNLGPDINSEEADYNPFIDMDETVLTFTSRRKDDNVGGKKVESDGYRSSDIFLSTASEGKWNKAKNAGRGLNGNLDEQVVGFRPDALEMYLYLDHIEKFGDLYYSTRRDLMSEFPKPKAFDPQVNGKIETSGFVTEDGSMMVFARRDNLESTSDLYMSRKLPNGKWGIPLPLPANVNTPQNEEQPYMSYDGETLYFASDGHNSMGGYDLFKCKWDQSKNTFSDPENLGFPINSTDDERCISVTRDNRLAYVSAFRPKGLGDLDIYRVKFNDAEPVSVIFNGRIFVNDTLPQSQPSSYVISVIVTNKKTQYEYTFVPHSKTGRLVMALPAGHYNLTTFGTGYASYIEDIEVDDVGRKDFERRKDIIVKKLKKGAR
jgi:hypothetical protein